MESFRLESIGELHTVAAELFVPFTVARLQQAPDDTEAVLTVSLHRIGTVLTEDRELRLHWGLASIPTRPFAVQEHTVTEWAALGVACAAIWQFAGLRLKGVATLGDGVDYWIARENQEYGLEVSGTMSTDLEIRHREKTRQLLNNPFGADGYVVVVSFANRRVILSFHRHEGASE